ncbi:hypothetical protein ACWCQL_15070 [Streptomyces sp. NPDC002073]|nr:hypothetical protein [Streptomyces sp. NBC_00239]
MLGTPLSRPRRDHARHQLADHSTGRPTGPAARPGDAAAPRDTTGIRAA